MIALKVPKLSRLLPILLLLAACDAGRETQLDFVTYASEAVGVSFDYPEQWVVQESGNAILVASSEELTASEHYAGGATANIIAGPAVGFEGNLTALLSELVALNANQDEIEVVNKPTEQKINAQDAATTRWIAQEGETEVVITASVIHEEAQILFLITIFDRDKEASLGPIIERLTNSITVGIDD